MKYEVYIYENHKYKNTLLTPLSTNLGRFLSLFTLDEDLAKYIILKRMYRLLELPIGKILTLTKKELEKVHLLTAALSLDDMLLLVKFCTNFSKVTKYNIHDMVRLIHEYKYIRSGELVITWGKGNHNNRMSNIYEHFNKHIMQDASERIYWQNKLDELTPLTYKSFVEDIFLKIDKVVIHSNGRLVYLSGFYGNFFVVGRYHNNIFGISSCYHVVNGEKQGRYVDECLTF